MQDPKKKSENIPFFSHQPNLAQISLSSGISHCGHGEDEGASNNCSGLSDHLGFCYVWFVKIVNIVNSEIFLAQFASKAELTDNYVAQRKK